MKWLPILHSGVVARGATAPLVDGECPRCNRRKKSSFMNLSRRNLAFGTVSLLAGTSLSDIARADDSLVPFEGLDDFWIATDAYIYGYPLVTMEMARRVVDNASVAG